ncbi:MAG: hypothetical protein ABI666_06055 [Ferruginibacter sp.]
MKRLLSLLFFLPALAGWCQQTKVIDVGKEDVRITASQFYTVGGEPMSSTKYVRVVSGTPYFNEAWMKGSLDLSDGHGYENLWLKLDLIDNSLLYLDAEGKEMIATSIIKNVTLIDSVSGRKYEFVHSSFINGTGKIAWGWYQVMVSGGVTLYKHAAKIINETKPYGLATYEQSIVTTNSYFLLADSVFSPIKKITALPHMLKNKKDELDQYISSKNLSGRSDADYATLITYYNSFFLK